MSAATDQRIFEFSGFRLDAAQRQLFGPDGAPIHLSSRAFDVLLFMVERPGDLLDKATLMNAVWPRSVVEDGNLTQCIFALRRAFGETAGEHRFIVTVPGRGYQFAARVRAMDALPTEVLAAPADVAADSSNAPDLKTIEAPPGKNYRVLTSRLVRSIAAVLVVVLLGYWLWPRAAPRASSEKSSPIAAVTPPQTIAVMPFSDLSPAGDMEYFADGMTEELIGSLGKVAPLRVVGLRASFMFKGGNDDARTIGEKLKVENLLEGSVRKEGDRIRISARLVKTKDGYSQWSETYDRKLDDVLGVQSTIARDVVVALKAVVLEPKDAPATAGIDTRLTRNADAYTAYLRGLHFIRPLTVESLQHARDEFARAVELDPQFARAHANLARSCALLARRSTGDTTQLWSLAYAAVDRALKLDPELADVWWLKAKFGERDNAPFSYRAHGLERALAGSPNDADAMFNLYFVYTRLGKRVDALRMIERAYITDPLWPFIIGSLAEASYDLTGDRHRALALAAEMETIAPQDSWPSAIRATIALIEGRPLDWDRWSARAVEVAPRDFWVHNDLALNYANLGEFDAARYHAQLSQQIDPRSAAGWYILARILLSSGNRTEARQVVRQIKARQLEGPFGFDVLADAELQYFDDDCKGAIDSIHRARPGLSQPPSSLDVVSSIDYAPLLAWCQRRTGNLQRASEIAHAFEIQFAPPWNPGQVDGLRARMATAMGNRDALVSHLNALAKTDSAMFHFSRNEPMLQPYRDDPAVKALLDTLEARRAEWRKVLPKTSTRIPIPGIADAQRETAVMRGTEHGK